MNTNNYNKRELEAGRITAEHITALTRAFQRAVEIEPDGKLGPVTRRALEAVPEATEGATTAVWPGPPSGAAAAVVFARDALARWTAATAAGKASMRKSFFADSLEYSNWCAAFVSSALAAGGIDVPRSGPTRRGAQALTKWVAAQGQWVVSPPRVAWAGGAILLPGDVICWRRGPEDWQGHVGIVSEVLSDGHVRRIAGNERNNIMKSWMSPGEWPNYLDGLYGVARPNYGGGR
jgi:hypothetical protein